jgi:hypothetical protein
MLVVIHNHQVYVFSSALNYVWNHHHEGQVSVGPDWRIWASVIVSSQTYERSASSLVEFGCNGIYARGIAGVLVAAGHNSSISRIRSFEGPPAGWRITVVVVITSRASQTRPLMHRESMPGPTVIVPPSTGRDGVRMLYSYGNGAVDVHIQVLTTGNLGKLSQWLADEVQ